MRSFAGLLVCALWLPAHLNAGVCTLGPLSGYLTTSCGSFGIDFDVWTYAPGATGVPATDILVTPSVAGPVFEFTSSI